MDSQDRVQGRANLFVFLQSILRGIFYIQVSAYRWVQLLKIFFISKKIVRLKNTIIYFQCYYKILKMIQDIRSSSSSMLQHSASEFPVRTSQVL